MYHGAKNGPTKQTEQDELDHPAASEVRGLDSAAKPAKIDASPEEHADEPDDPEQQASCHVVTSSQLARISRAMCLATLANDAMLVLEAMGVLTLAVIIAVVKWRLL